MQHLRRWIRGVALAIACAACGAGAQTVLWSQGVPGKATFDAEPGSSDSRHGPKNVAVDAAGNVFVAGIVDNDFNDDVLVVKYDGATGNALWGQHYNGAGNSEDWGIALALDPAGNPVVVGHTRTASVGRDVLVLKYDGATGALLWSFTANGGANQDDYGRAVAVNASGDVFVAAELRTVATGSDVALYKLNGATGAIAWVQLFDGWTFDEAVYGMTLDAAGNPVVIGGTISTVDGFNALAVKFDGATGARTWKAEHNHSGADYFFDAAVHPSGDIVAVGRGANSPVGLAARINGADGSFVWVRTYGGPGSEFFSAAVDGAGDVITAGMTTTTTGEFWAAKLAGTDGSLRWEYVLDGPGGSWDAARHVILDTAGNAYVTGYIHMGFSTGATREDIHTVKLAAADGTMLWGSSYDNGGASGDRGYGMALDPAGRIVVVGAGFNGNDNDFVVLKLRPDLGEILWKADEGTFVPTYTNLGSSESPLALDGAGNAYVTGTTRRSGNTDLFVARLDASTGAIAWKSAARASVYGNVGNAVVASGSVVAVTGSVFDYATGSDIFTLRYDAATGAEIWRHRFNSGGTQSESGAAIAADTAGNVYVVGSGGASSSQNVIVLKIDGASGALAWSRLIDLNGGSTDAGFQVRIDSAGDVLVGGYAYGGGFASTAVFALKLSGATGNTVWTQLDAGPGAATSSFGFGDLVLDASGNVVIAGYAAGRAFASKLEGATGNRLWGTTAATPDSYAYSVRIHGATGRVGIAGRGNLNDMHAVLLDGATGAIVWEALYPNAGSDIGYALAFDAGGNLVAAGSLSNGSNNDIGIAAFSASAGAVLWNVRYAGSRNDYDVAYAAQADAAGNIVVAGDARESVFYNTRIHVMKVASGGGTPVASFSPASLAFAPQPVGTTSSAQTITLTNTGTAALSISNVAISGEFAYSGCAFPANLAAGASCTFAVTFRPLAAGVSTGALTVTTNATGSPHSIGLSGSGSTATASMLLVQPSGIEFGRQIVDRLSATYRIAVRNESDAPVPLTGFESYPRDFPMHHECPAMLPAREFCWAYVSFRPSVPGEISGSFIVRSGTLMASVSLHGVGEAEPPPRLAFSAAVDFGPVVTGNVRLEPIRLTNTGGGTLVVDSWRVTGEAFRVTGQCTALGPGETCILQASFTAGAVGVARGSLDLATSAGPHSIALVGESVPAPAPQLVLTPGSIGFGNQMLATTSEPQEVELANVGNARLVLAVIRATGDFAVAHECPGLLEPGERCTARVRFRTTTTGPRHGIVGVESNDAASPHALSLSGTGCRFYTIAGSRIARLLCAP